MFPDEFHEFIEPNDLTPEKFKEIVLPKWSADDLRHPHLREEILDALALWRKAIEELEETLRSYK